jgi:hypothetical protein
VADLALAVDCYRTVAADLLGTATAQARERVA